MFLQLVTAIYLPQQCWCVTPPFMHVAPCCIPSCAELSDLQDPEGVAQTTVALLSQKAPEKNLQQFLDNKIAGGELSLCLCADAAIS